MSYHARASILTHCIFSPPEPAGFNFQRSPTLVLVIHRRRRANEQTLCRPKDEAALAKLKPRYSLRTVPCPFPSCSSITGLPSLATPRNCFLLIPKLSGEPTSFVS